MSPCGKANGRATADDAAFFVFNNSNVAAAPGQAVAPGTYYLGRPWSRYARVVFQHSALGAVVNAAGWRVWNTRHRQGQGGGGSGGGDSDDDARTGNVLFGEFANSGPGAQGRRASFATSLAAPVPIEDILAPGYASQPYYDGAYMRRTGL